MQSLYSFRFSFARHLAMYLVSLMSMIVHWAITSFMILLCFRNIMILSITLTVTLNCSALRWL